MDAPARAPRPDAMRSFDPRAVGRLECATWVAYYRRQWGPFLRSAVGMTRAAFGMPWPRTLAGAWLVLRANQLWAPYPRNHPDAARRRMRRFYSLLQRTYGEPDDAAHAAGLEVEWWRVHRELQHHANARRQDLIDALARLYGYVYRVPPEQVRPAAAERAAAMAISDDWVAAGCDPEVPPSRRRRQPSSAPTPRCSPPYTGRRQRWADRDCR